MSDTPRRRAIVEAFQTRLGAIAVADGFRTDAGLHIFLQETPALGDDDPDIAIALLTRADESSWQGEHVMLRLPVEIQAVAKDSLDAPWLLVEDLLADIKTAVELEDRTLGGLVRRQIERGATVTVERAEGSTVVGLSITYVAPYTERWGHPEV